MIIFLLAILWANSPWRSFYFSLFQEPIYIFRFEIVLNQIINNGMMPFFFLLVSLEVKRELLVGQLNSLTKALLPFIAAIGGMVLPAAIYLSLNITHHVNARGWAIPTATDIVFSLTILLLLRSYVPYYLKTFLTALAIIDDLGAIIIIAFFYTHNFQILYVFLALLCVLTLLIFNWINLTSFFLYFIVGVILWLFILKSGIHSTIAGVIFGFSIPLKDKKNYSPLKKLECDLEPWVSYGVLPLFAFANTGLAFSDIKLSSLFHPVTLGIFLGLFIGKQLGVFLAIWIAIKTRIAKVPDFINWWHMYGVSVLCGIGFTMSLFIGDLSFENYQEIYGNLVKLGVLSGSIISGVIGFIVLWLSRTIKKN